MSFNKTRFLENFFLFIACVPLMIYGLIAVKYTTNVPYLDDLFWGIYCLDEYIHATSFIDKINVVFKQHNQHKMAFFKGSLVFYYELFGELNFKILGILGNFSNLIVLVLAALSLKKINKSLFYLIPVGFLLFQVQYYFNIILTFSFPNQSVYAWALLTFYLLSLNQPKWFYLSLFTGFSATFSNGNGILVFPLMLFFLVIQKKWRFLYLCIAASAFSFIIYFSRFVSNSEEIVFAKKSVLFFLKMLSSGFSTTHQPLELVFLELCLVFYGVKIIYDLYQIVFRKQASIISSSWIFLNATLIWILGSSALVAMFRASYYLTIPNWYYNYSILFGIFFMIWVLYHLKKRYLHVFVGIFCLFFSFEVYSASFIQYLNPIRYLHAHLKADEYNFNLNQKFSFYQLQFGSENYENCNKILNQFKQLGIYRPAALPQNLSNLPSKTDTTSFILSKEINQETGYSFKLSEKSFAEMDEILGVIKSKDKRYFYGISQQVNSDRVEILKNLTLFKNDFKMLIANTYYEKAIKDGEYEVGYVIIKKDGKAKWFFSKDQKIQIKKS